MTTAAPSTAPATIQPAFTDPERLALAGFLAGYRGTDKRGLHSGPAPVHHLVPCWLRCRCSRSAAPTSKASSREPRLEGRARATVTRRLCTIAGFYKYAVEEELLDDSPAAHVRRPRLDYE